MSEGKHNNPARKPQPHQQPKQPPQAAGNQPAQPQGAVPNGENTANKAAAVPKQPAVAPKQPPTGPPPIPPQVAEQIQALKKKLDDKDAQISKVMDAYRQLKKDNERTRQRLETDLKRRVDKSKNEFIGQFVDVLDNLDRAIDAVENNFDSDSVLQGIILLRSRLVQLLRLEGLEKIFVDNQPFDPLHSEAAGVEEVESEDEDNLVIRELQRGYTMKGSLLRPARVVVGRYSGPRESKDETETQE